METKEILKRLRESHQLTQEQMAERLMVTRQAVSRWENGETQPNTETLKLLSREFHVSVNTLLGALRQLICQCCGMPLNEDDSISREAAVSMASNAGPMPRQIVFTKTDFMCSLSWALRLWRRMSAFSLRLRSSDRRR